MTTLLYCHDTMADGPSEATGAEETSIRPPEQEWCTECALDKDAAPGMPRTIVSSTMFVDRCLPQWARPKYTVLFLECHHTVVIKQ
ncbi:hypothetical protein [Streptomyces sp. NPDC007083]|uniref:hypothetical protein n=1 Tax=Streptomyces sp. NPDC007083 TaxID=3156913 RepID=UPI00340D8610